MATNALSKEVRHGTPPENSNARRSRFALSPGIVLVTSNEIVERLRLNLQSQIKPLELSQQIGASVNSIVIYVGWETLTVTLLGADGLGLLVLKSIWRSSRLDFPN